MYEQKRKEWIFMGCDCNTSFINGSHKSAIACKINGVIQQDCPSGEQTYIQCAHPVPITVSILNTGVPLTSCDMTARLKGPGPDAVVTIAPAQQKVLCSDRATELTIECTGGGVLGTCVGIFEGCVGAVNS
jgi:hypothetical protein